MEIFTSVVGTLLAAFLIYVFTYKGRKPKLSIEIKSLINSSSAGPVVELIKENESDDGYSMRKTIRIFILEWKQKIIIRNSGVYDAQSVELFFHNKSPILKYHPEINILEAIKKHDFIELESKYILRERKSPSNRSQIEATKILAFKDLKIMLKYRDQFGFTNYTKYEYATRKNKYRTFFRFRGFKSKDQGTIPEGFFK